MNSIFHVDTFSEVTSDSIVTVAPVALKAQEVASRDLQTSFLARLKRQYFVFGCKQKDSSDFSSSVYSKGVETQQYERSTCLCLHWAKLRPHSSPYKGPLFCGSVCNGTKVHENQGDPGGINLF